MPPGKYNITVRLAGFQTGAYQAVQIVLGQTYDLKAILQPGQVTSTVTVEAGQQVLETTQSSVGLTISGPTITNVPTPSNSALYGLALMSPDIQTIGGPRQSSADGLPGGAVNITYDGISAQWQTGKSGDPLIHNDQPEYRRCCGIHGFVSREQRSRYGPRRGSTPICKSARHQPVSRRSLGIFPQRRFEFELLLQQSGRLTAADHALSPIRRKNRGADLEE